MLGGTQGAPAAEPGDHHEEILHRDAAGGEDERGRHAIESWSDQAVERERHGEEEAEEQEREHGRGRADQAGGGQPHDLSEDTAPPTPMIPRVGVLRCA